MQRLSVDIVFIVDIRCRPVEDQPPLNSCSIRKSNLNVETGLVYYLALQNQEWLDSSKTAGSWVLGSNNLRANVEDHAVALKGLVVGLFDEPV